MTVFIQEPGQSPRELDLAEVNCLLSAGLLDTESIAWTPGLEDWVPLHELPGIHMPIPPPFPSLTPASPVEATASSLQPSEATTNPILAYFLPIGRIGRGVWFWQNLLNSFAVGILVAPFAGSENIIAMTIGVSLVILWCYLILITSAKRLHDLNVSAWFCWIVLIFLFVFPFVLLFLLILSGTEGSNKYGSDPANTPVEKIAFTATKITIIVSFLVVLIILVSLIIPACSKALERGRAHQSSSAPQSEAVASSPQNQSISPSKDVPVSEPNIPETFDAKRIYQEASPRIVKIEVMDNLGHTVGQGSGVALGPSMSESSKKAPSILNVGTDILTNYHVIEDASFVIVETKDGQTLAANIVFFDRRSDLAIIRIPETIASTEIRISNSPEVGDKVAAIGHPLGLPLTISEGIISRAPDEKRGILQTTAAISHGSSGGGLFDSSGNLAGIIVAGSISNEAQNLNMAIWLNSERVKAIAKLRKGGAISFGSNLLSMDNIVGYYQWDSNCLPDEKFDWRDTYRKNTKFADYIKSFDLERELIEIKVLRPSLMKDEKFQSVIRRRYESFPKDPFACLAYLNIVEDKRQKELLLIEWLDRWPTYMFIFREVGMFYMQNNREEMIRIIFKIRDIIYEPSEDWRMMTDGWSRSQYGEYKLRVEEDRKNTIDRFNEVLLDFSREAENYGVSLDFSFISSLESIETKNSK